MMQVDLVVEKELALGREYMGSEAAWMTRRITWRCGGVTCLLTWWGSEAAVADVAHDVAMWWVTCLLKW